MVPAFCIVILPHNLSAQRGLHPTRKPSTDWLKVPPALSSSPAMPFCTKESVGMQPPLGGDSFGSNNRTK